MPLDREGGTGSKGDTASAGTGVPQVPQVRLTQNDPRIAVMVGGVNVMATQGCFFMANLGVAQTEANRTFTERQIRSIISETRAMGALREDMVVEPGRGADIVTAALTQAGSGLGAAEVRGTLSDPADASLVRGIVASGRQHWREGDASGVVLWDPYPGLQFRAGGEQVGYVYYRFVQRR